MFYALRQINCTHQYKLCSAAITLLSLRLQSNKQKCSKQLATIMQQASNKGGQWHLTLPHSSSQQVCMQSKKHGITHGLKINIAATCRYVFNMWWTAFKTRELSKQPAACYNHYLLSFTSKWKNNSSMLCWKNDNIMLSWKKMTEQHIIFILCWKNVQFK